MSETCEHNVPLILRCSKCDAKLSRPSISRERVREIIHEIAVDHVCPIHRAPSTVFEINMVKTFTEMSRAAVDAVMRAAGVTVEE